MHTIQQMIPSLRANTSMETDTISTGTQSLQLYNTPVIPYYNGHFNLDDGETFVYIYIYCHDVNST